MMQIILHGGWAMLPIAFCSVAALAVYLAKRRSLAKIQRADLTFVGHAVSALRARRPDAARQSCVGAAHPVGAVLAALIDVAERRPDRAEAEAERVAKGRLAAVEAHVDWLGFIAHVAPLLGLLGTALGMVELFSGLESAGLGDIDVAQLSSGIWKALSTTAAGLVVAIPALAGHRLLERRADGIRLTMEDCVARVLHELPPGGAP